MAKTQLRSEREGTAERADSGSGFLSDFISKVKKFDGWTNILTGIGLRSKDARLASEVKWRRLSETEIEELYAGDAMAAKVVDLVVEEATNKGYRITGVKPKQEDAIRARLKELHFDETIVEAAKKGRLYGGAAILKGYSDDLKLETPVREGKKTIRSLVVFNRFELFSTWEDVQKDMLSPDFGTPLVYTFIGRNAAAAYISNVKIHFSRLVRFDGAWLPDRLRQSNGYWNDSVLSKVYDAVRNYAFAHDSVNAALKDMSVAVFKLKNLAAMLDGDQDSAVINRLEIVNLTKSIARAVVLDAEGEEFDYKVRNLTGASELVDRAEARLAAETSIPRTVLLGESPKGGLGQSGDTESSNWYDFLEAYQQKRLKPQMMEIIVEVAEELGVKTENLDIEFNPLWQMSEKEVVELRERQSQTDQRYIEIGVIDPSEVRESRFGGDKYSIETALDASITTDDLAPPMPMPNLNDPNQPPNPNPNDPKEGE